ncbi:urease accessory protein UreE-like [Thrips palmi]|uniref:Urease accessory protein UreE-like n=1 Tax=Thrips palmi TaxID=161013 RepID=A0A6P8Z4I7_THRPL|nr:urease accessory protein UreE-like [Thrips palmi]
MLDRVPGGAAAAAVVGTRVTMAASWVRRVWATVRRHWDGAWGALCDRVLELPEVWSWTGPYEPLQQPAPAASHANVHSHSHSHGHSHGHSHNHSHGHSHRVAPGCAQQKQLSEQTIALVRANHHSKSA